MASSAPRHRPSPIPLNNPARRAQHVDRPAAAFSTALFPPPPTQPTPVHTHPHFALLSFVPPCSPTPHRAAAELLGAPAPAHSSRTHYPPRPTVLSLLPTPNPTGFLLHPYPFSRLLHMPFPPVGPCPCAHTAPPLFSRSLFTHHLQALLLSPIQGCVMHPNRPNHVQLMPRKFDVIFCPGYPQLKAGSHEGGETSARSLGS